MYCQYILGIRNQSDLLLQQIYPCGILSAKKKEIFWRNCSTWSEIYGVSWRTIIHCSMTSYCRPQSWLHHTISCVNDIPTMAIDHWCLFSILNFLYHLHLFSLAKDTIAGALTKYEPLWQNDVYNDDFVLFIFSIIILKEVGYHRNAIMTDKFHYLWA